MLPELKGLPTGLLAGLVAGALLLAGGCAAAPHHGAAAAPAAGPSRGPTGGPATPTPDQPAPNPPRRPGPWRVVALGDSVTSGARCGCMAFPSLYGKDLARARGTHVTVRNLGQGGQDSTGLLAQLRRPGSAQQSAVRRVDIVLVTIGANDFGDHHADVVTDRCALTARRSCVDGEMRELGRNMRALLARIHALRAGRPTAVLVTGYWNVFEDGNVARRAFSPAGFRATRRLTFQADAVLRSATVAEGATFVGLYAPFHGPAAHGDVTNLLASDGNHPDAAGQALIADRLLAAGLHGLVSG